MDLNVMWEQAQSAVPEPKKKEASNLMTIVLFF